MTSSPASESLEHARFAVVDVETTGMRAQVGGRILEVAVAILEGGTIHLAFEALLDPGTRIPPWVTRLTGITGDQAVGNPGEARHPWWNPSPRVEQRLEGEVDGSALEDGHGHLEDPTTDLGPHPGRFHIHD